MFVNQRFNRVYAASQGYNILIISGVVKGVRRSNIILHWEWISIHSQFLKKVKQRKFEFRRFSKTMKKLDNDNLISKIS